MLNIKSGGTLGERLGWYSSDARSSWIKERTLKIKAIDINPEREDTSCPSTHYAEVPIRTRSHKADMALITTLFRSLQMQMDRQQRQFDYVLGGNMSVPPPPCHTNSKYADRHCSDTEVMSTYSRQTDCTYDKGVVYEHNKGEN